MPGLTLLGHQGGWDEVLYFVVPVLAVVAWVRWAEKRARRRREDDEGTDEEVGPAERGADDEH